jgi:hypothetical protein
MNERETKRKIQLLRKSSYAKLKAFSLDTVIHPKGFYWCLLSG